MSAPSAEPRSGWRTVGIVGAACVACCAGPLLAAVGGIGLLGSLAAFLLWPAAGVAVAATTVSVVIHLRHRQPRAGRLVSTPGTGPRGVGGGSRDSEVGADR